MVLSSGAQRAGRNYPIFLRSTNFASEKTPLYKKLLSLIRDWQNTLSLIMGVF